MKKIFILFVFICLCSLCACSSSKKENISNDDKKIVITTTIFPIYDFVKNITKGIDGIEINMLLDSGIDLHNFQPSAKDIITVKNSDLFIYVGGESDKWVESTLDTADNKNLKAINLISELDSEGMNDVFLYSEPDSMEISGSEDTEEEHESEDDEEVYDEHIWLSLNNAKGIVNVITENLINYHTIKNTDVKNVIISNATNYTDKLVELNEKFYKLFDTDGEKVMVVADRFPFVYFCEDYDIKYFAAFKGCSSQTEASFKTIKFLTDKVDEYNLKYIFKIEKSDTKIAETIIQNSKNKDQKILTLNSIQEVNKDEIENGASYLSLMKDNYNILKDFVSK